jgi:predicted nucleotidyltransferase
MRHNTVVETVIEARASEAQLAAECALVREATRLLVELYQPLRIYLFGSRARGDYHTDSDYDMLLVVPDDADAANRSGSRFYRATALQPLGVELHICRQSWFDEQRGLPGSFGQTVLREGRVLYAA